MSDYNQGKTPEVIEQHEKVAQYYAISSINLAKEVNDRILNGEFTWRDDFKDLHPSPFGQELYLKSIKYLLEKSWSATHATSQYAKQIPDTLLDRFSFNMGHFKPITHARLIKGWKLESNWKPTDNSSTREGFVNIPVLEATTPGAVLKLNFTGTAIGLFITSGPDTGILEYSIDGKDFVTVDQFTQWSTILHLPWLILLDDKLTIGKHNLVLRTAATKNSKSTGYSCRINQFTVNN